MVENILVEMLEMLFNNNSSCNFLENHAEIPSNLGCKSPYKTQLKFLIILLSYRVILLVKIIILFDVGNESMEKGCDVIDKGRVGVCIPGKG